MNRQIRDLQDRINNLGGARINKNRRPLYRYEHKGLDPVENWAWRFFVEMQLTSLEIAELRGNEKQRRQLGHASIVQPSSPDKAAQDRVLYDRSVALKESAELRAEAILEHDAAEWHSWLDFFRSTVWPALQGAMADEVSDETIDAIWDFKLRYWDGWKRTHESDGS